MAKENIKDLKILVVDDDTFALDLITATLNEIAVTDVQTVSSGRDAFNLFDKDGGDFEVVMCDLYMPDMDGFEFLGKLHKSGFDGNLVLFSGVDRVMLERAERLAVDSQIKVLGSLEKPITQEALIGLLSKVVPYG